MEESSDDTWDAFLHEESEPPRLYWSNPATGDSTWLDPRAEAVAARANREAELQQQRELQERRDQAEAQAVENMVATAAAARNMMHPATTIHRSMASLRTAHTCHSTSSPCLGRTRRMPWSP